MKTYGRKKNSESQSTASLFFNASRFPVMDDEYDIYPSCSSSPSRSGALQDLKRKERGEENYINSGTNKNHRSTPSAYGIENSPNATCSPIETASSASKSTRSIKILHIYINIWNCSLLLNIFRRNGLKKLAPNRKKVIPLKALLETAHHRDLEFLTFEIKENDKKNIKVSL